MRLRFQSCSAAKLTAIAKASMEFMTPPKKAMPTSAMTRHSKRFLCALNDAGTFAKIRPSFKCTAAMRDCGCSGRTRIAGPFCSSR